jgi:hypothetical protein
MEYEQQLDQQRHLAEHYRLQAEEFQRQLAPVEGLGRFSLGVARRVHKFSVALPWLSRCVKGLLKTVRKQPSARE